MELQEIREIADGLLEYCCSTRPRQIIKELGIKLVCDHTSMDCMALFSRNKEGKEFIFLNPACPQELEDFVLAHEIGHAVLHDVEIINFSPLEVSKSKIEKEADLFAFYLLGLEIEEIDGFTIKNYSSLLGVNDDVIEGLKTI